MPADKALVDPFKVYSNVAFRAGTVSIFPSSGLCCKQKEMVKKKNKKKNQTTVWYYPGKQIKRKPMQKLLFTSDLI